MMKSYKFKSGNFELEVRKENNTIQIWNDEFGLLKLYFKVKGTTSETISMNAEREFIFVPRTKELSMDEFSKFSEMVVAYKDIANQIKNFDFSN